MHLSQSPACDVEVFVIEAEVDVRDQWWHRAEALQEWWQIFSVFWAWINGDDLLGLPHPVVIAPPCEDRALQVGGVHDHTAEAVGLGRIMRGPDFQRHLVILT